MTSRFIVGHILQDIIRPQLSSFTSPRVTLAGYKRHFDNPTPSTAHDTATSCEQRPWGGKRRWLVALFQWAVAESNVSETYPRSNSSLS
jgi:hypothetical protein